MVAYSTVNLLGDLLAEGSDSLLICLEVAPLKPSELKYCRISANWGSVRPKYFRVVQWNHENTKDSVGLLLRVWQNDRNIAVQTDCVVVPPLETCHLPKQMEFIHLPPKAQSHPVMFLLTPMPGWGWRAPMTCCPWKSDVTYRVLCLHWEKGQESWTYEHLWWSSYLNFLHQLLPW